MRKNVVAVLLVFLLALAGAARPALAGGRLALVLGNSAYQAAPALDNPANDAADLAQSLRAIGFDVIEQRDGSRDAMAKAVRDFAERIRGADVALFFYAGHGLQMNGENYLIPVDARIQNEADVRFNTINVTDILQEMDGAGRANIIILDACRNNPFAEKLTHNGRGVTTRGLGRIEPSGVGSLVVFSTSPDKVALDGSSRNSPFTSALLKYVRTPGLEVRQLISKVRGDVLAATNNQQLPWDNSSLVGDVYLAGAPAADAPAVVAQAEPPKPAPVEPAKPAAVAEAAPQKPADPAASRAAPDPVVAGDTGNAAECDRLAAPPIPLSVPSAVQRAHPIDWDRAIEVCEAAVKERPSPRMEFQLGRAYGQKKSYMLAVRHYSIAADAGYADAQNALGFMFVMGQGVVKDYQRAFDLFNKAAIAGNSYGMGNLGSMYSNGFFVKEDDAKALDWYEKAIEAGDAFGLAQAGVMYFNGKGTPQDYAMAAQYFQQAADLGDGYSLKFLAIMEERGLLGKADPAKAAELRLRAAEVDPDSQDPNAPPPARVVTREPSHSGGTRHAGSGGGRGDGPGDNQFYTGTVHVNRWHGIATHLPRCWPMCTLN